MNKRPMGVTRTARTLENVESVRQALLRKPNCSGRKRSTQPGNGNRSIRHILHEYLHFHYKLVIAQQFKPGGYAQRLNFAREMGTIFEANDNLILLMSDEAHFRVNSNVIILFMKIQGICTTDRWITQT